jgi:hypothetical protein
LFGSNQAKPPDTSFTKQKGKTQQPRLKLLSFITWRSWRFGGWRFAAQRKRPPYRMAAYVVIATDFD